MSRASRTARMVAAYRARATAKEDAICTDPWAARLAGEEGFAIAKKYDDVYPHMELWTAVRTAFIDAQVRELTKGEKISQIVLLGAGFDTRAARLAIPGARFFEVDQPASHDEKQNGLAALTDYPVANATYVTCDFEKEDFIERLRASAFDAGAPALFIWEGVTPYLTEAAVRSTLRRIATGVHPESMVIFDHLRRKIVAGEARDPKDLESRAFVADLGEPLRFGVDYPLPFLYEEGFRSVRTFTFDEICLELTGTYERERAFRFQGLVIAGRARAPSSNRC
ncbi:MAG: class I SAM-dependent methyltransferase [Polyangiaceae bacterium]